MCSKKDTFTAVQDECFGVGGESGMSGGATGHVSRAANISRVFFEGSYPTTWVQTFGLHKLIICLRY
jgi:hypothetical protein